MTRRISGSPYPMELVREDPVLAAQAVVFDLAVTNNLQPPHARLGEPGLTDALEIRANAAEIVMAANVALVTRQPEV